MKYLQHVGAVSAVLSMSLVAAAVAASPLALKPDALLQIDLNRAAVVERILSSWSTEAPSAQMESLKSMLMGLRADQLLAANVSGSFDGVLTILHNQDAAQTQSTRSLLRDSRLQPVSTADRSKGLGEADRDLVYTPVTPCRIFDTREAIGQLAPGVQRNLQVIATSFTSQGGVATNCNIDPSAKAAVINFVVESPTGQGHITVWPANQGIPLASSLNFAPASVQVAEANGLIMPLCTSACPDSAEIAAQATHNTHIVGDVTGYFAAPGGTIGDITSVTAGAGLTGGGTSGSATLALATTQLLPTTACATNQIAKWNGTAWACAADASPVNAWTQGGNAFGVPGIIGTTDAQNLTVQSGGNLASFVVPGGNGLRVIQTTGAYVGAPNTVNGSSVNTATAQGGTVAGGGEASTTCFNPATGTAIRNCRNEASEDVATVGGGISNVASGVGASVGGGASNSASNQLATIAGGRGHRASGEYSAIGGGNLNEATNQFATVAGGGSSKASGQYAAVGGGNLNEATNIRATVAGGFTNRATGASSVVGGGHTNTASFDASTVSGGLGNTASGGYAAIGGGQANTASAAHSIVGGGQNNTTNGAHSVVGGGQNNAAVGPHSTISGGIGAATRLHGQYARAAGSFDANTPGLAQHSEYVLRRETTDAAPYAARLNGNESDRLSLEAGRAATVDIMVVGLQQGSPHRTASFAFKCNAQNVSGGIVLVQPAGCNRQIIWQDDPAWNAYIPVPSTPGAFDIVVQGVANTTIRWVATVRAVEVKW